MTFDKNESVFPSEWHREVWWWAVGLVPPFDSLTDAVKERCSDNVLDGCCQWYEYFKELCEDMYRHIDIYAPASPRQYRDILENIAAKGRLQENLVVWQTDDWLQYSAKVNKSKAYASSNITLEKCLTALERTGLKCEDRNGTVVFSNEKYPKIFHATHTFEHSPNVKKTPARHHFAHCAKTIIIKLLR